MTGEEWDIYVVNEVRDWISWYEEAIPLAEQRCEAYLKERAQEEG